MFSSLKKTLFCTTVNNKYVGIHISDSDTFRDESKCLLSIFIILIILTFFQKKLKTDKNDQETPSCKDMSNEECSSPEKLKDSKNNMSPGIVKETTESPTKNPIEEPTNAMKTPEKLEMGLNNNENKEDFVVNGCSNNNNLDLLDKCDTCGQFLNNSDIIYYQGHPQDAVEEFIALTNEKLVLASGNN